MTMLPFQTIASIASALGHALLDGIWLGAILAFVLAIALRVLKGINAASRHAIWYAALIAIAALPVVGFGWSLSHASAPAASAPAASAPSTGESRQSTGTHISFARTGAPAGAVRAHAAAKEHSAGADRVGSTAAAIPPEQQWPFNASQVVLAVVGIAGIISIAGLGGVLLSLIRLLAVKNESRAFDPAVEDTLRRWSERPAGGRAVSLRVSQGVDVPAAVGFMHPSSLVPASWPANLDADELDKIVMHEYSHLRRADDWTAFVQRLAERIFWFNPAMRYIAGRANLEREIACDDWVVSEYTSATSYAECLWRIAQFAHMPAAKSLVPAALVTRAQIVERIEHLMNSDRDIVPRIRPAALAAIVPLAAALLVIGVVRAPAITLAAAPAAAAARPASPVSIAADAVPAASHAIAAHTIASHANAAARVAHAPSKVASAIPARAAQPSKVSAWPTDSNAPSQVRTAAAASAKIVALSGSGLDVRSLLQACAGCDLSGKNLQNADLHGLRLSGDDMSNVDFRGANLRGIRFEGVNLDGARFDDADLTDAVFAGTDLKHATWSGAKISGIELQGVAIDSAMLRVSQAKTLLNSCQGCDMAGLDMRNLDLSGIRLQGADLSHADLRGANLSGAKLDGVDLGGAQLDGTDLTNASLNGCDLTNVDLRHAHIQGLKLEGADLRKLQFSGLDVRGLTADGADLSGAALQHVDLTRVRMNGADFQNADLTGAQLVNGEFTGADFRRARLDNANLQGATLCGYNTYTDDSGRQVRREIACSDLSGASVQGTNFRGVQLCDWHDDVTACRAISGADLKRYSHSNLTGAVLPSF
jgi:uncharacterized protein YjbI with pentapeptide repeats/beta-lactamase regulating signal transducer with metallopeptidase domain